VRGKAEVTSRILLHGATSYTVVSDPVLFGLFRGEASQRRLGGQTTYYTNIFFSIKKQSPFLLLKNDRKAKSEKYFKATTGCGRNDSTNSNNDRVKS
jgi:hypothetical protein